MSLIVHKRELSEAVHVLVKKIDPDLHDMQAVGVAFAQVLTDLTGVNCRLVIKMDAKALQDAIARTGMHA